VAGSRGAAVFLGEYQHTLDVKGRVSLPRRFRDEIGTRVVVSKGLESCLYVYSADGHRAFLDALLSAGDFDRNSRAVRRFFMAGANESDIDSAGRVMVPQVLREFEVWDAKAWQAYEDANATTIEDAAEELSRSGIL
jgi:MraZ protein